MLLSRRTSLCGAAAFLEGQTKPPNILLLLADNWA
jgi:hypothetical protein